LLITRGRGFRDGPEPDAQWQLLAYNRNVNLSGIDRMKAIILAGGFGTRISEETALRPKPMVEIGGLPILWHILKLYSAHGISDFIICCGYKGYVIKEYFADYSSQPHL
jgi:choline kinase